MIRSSLVFVLGILAGCTQPMISADMAIGSNGLTVNPTLSGLVGDTTISIQPN